MGSPHAEARIAVKLARSSCETNMRIGAMGEMLAQGVATSEGSSSHVLMEPRFARRALGERPYEVLPGAISCMPLR